MSERFARNTLYGVIAAMFSSLGSFATTVVIARLLGVNDTGVVNFALWVASLATAATDLGAYASLARYLPELTRSGTHARGQQLAGYLLLPFTLATLLGLTAFIAMASTLYVYPDLVSRYELDAGAGMWVLIGLLYVAQAFSNFAVGYFHGMQRFDVAAKFAFYTGVVRLIGTALGCYFLGVVGALLGYLAALAATAPVPFFVSRYGGKLPRVLRRRVGRYAMFSWASTFAAALIVARPELAFLNYFNGKEAVGLYASAFTLASLAIQGPMLLTAGLVPYFSQHAGSEGRPLLQKMMSSGTRIMAFMILPMAFGTAAIAGQLIILLYGPAFAQAADPAIILIASSCLGGNTVLFAGLIIGMERSDFTFYLNLSGAVLTLLIALVLVPQFGTSGAAAGRALVQLYLFAVSSWFVVRRLNYEIPFSQLARLAGAAAGCAVVARMVLYAQSGAIGVVLAIPCAAIAYFLLVRALNGIESSDVERLKNLLNGFPGAVRLPVTAVFVRLAPRG